ncbi:hypothetical protein [Beijerinckia sp. L45]|uniref:hypothetical protein n=1 Tax=Beijerinckia sp. L45 TaxID=1641855 RepID=UPI00131B5BAE|nr:hypothetical protein [Beijerinckia sp. L45]
MSEGISQREFARRDQCDEKLVRRKVTQGYLIPNADGTLDPGLVGTDWRKRPKKPAPIADIEPEIVEADEDAVDAHAERIASQLVTSPDFVMLSEAQAKQKKENYLALLKQLEYDVKSGAVVLVEDVASAVVAEFARVRNKLLSIPTRVAPRASILKTANEVKSLLEAEIVLALQELSYDVQADQI